MAETIIETEKHVKTLSRPLLSKKNKEIVRNGFQSEPTFFEGKDKVDF